MSHYNREESRKGTIHMLFRAAHVRDDTRRHPLGKLGRWLSGRTGGNLTTAGIRRWRVRWRLAWWVVMPLVCFLLLTVVSWVIRYAGMGRESDLWSAVAVVIRCLMTVALWVGPYLEERRTAERVLERRRRERSGRIGI